MTLGGLLSLAGLVSVALPAITECPGAKIPLLTGAGFRVIWEF